MPLVQLNKVRHDGYFTDERDGTCLVDIVAIHGLNENMIEAWTHPETEVLWLRDLLPKAVQAARVLTFGYSAYASSFYGSGSADRIQQHAQTLVADLQADRSLEGCSQRPIIFVCHGLGGILVKKALAYSSTKTSPHVEHLYSIFVSTFAILFFGTPHNGMDKANWLTQPRAEGSPPVTQVCEPSQLLSAVEKDSETLQMITDQFAPLMKQFHIFFFWEEVQTEFGNRTGFVVEESSAAPTIDNTERSGIYATHSRMVQFSEPRSSSYRTVVEALIRYCRQAPEVITHRRQQAAVSLAHDRSNAVLELMGTAFDIHNDNQPFHYPRKTSGSHRNKHFYIPQVVSSIFTGREDASRIVENALLTSDATVSPRQQRRYIIYGIGGSGKTQFCCKFAQDHRERFWGVFWIDATSSETARHSFSKIGKIGGLEATESSGKHWLSHLEEPWLLIINNADDPSLELQTFFPEGERGHILVTTRNPNLRVHATVGSTEFKELQKREALHLLLKAAAVPSPWDSSTEDNGNKIANALGYLALALIQAGALILQRICDMSNFLDFYNQYRVQLSASRSANNGDKRNQYTVYSTWDLSLNFLERQRTEASRDAVQLLSIVAFFHFEHIRVDIFTRALSNRATVLQRSRNSSFSARLSHAIHNRLRPPLLLPEYLRQEPLDPYRVRRALHELRSFSLISYDGQDDSFSLHPVVHAWARDRMGSGRQALWAQIALNTLAESIQLPPNDSGKVHEDFRRDILPHLELCLSACSIQIFDYGARFGGFRFPFALVLQYTSLLNFQQEVLIAAKCGYVYAERGRFKDAAMLLSLVKDALVQSRGYEDETTMRAMLALAGTYWGLGRLEEAVSLQRVVVEARTKVFGPQHSETLLAMDQLGRSYWLNGQYHEAIKLQMLTTEQMRTIMGPTHADTLAAMDNLGVTLGSWQRYQESMVVHRQVLESRETMLGPTHVDTLTTMNNLAMALLDLGRTDEAGELIVKVYEERKTKLGKEHPWTLWALCNLAKVQSKLGLLEEAEDLLVPGIAAAKRSLSDDHLGVLMGSGELARVFARQGRFDEAENLTHDTVQRLERSRGPGHPDTVYALWQMARLYELQNKIEKAIEACELAVERVDIRLTKVHPLGKQIDSHLGTLRNRLQFEGECQSLSAATPARDKIHRHAKFLQHRDSW